MELRLQLFHHGNPSASSDSARQLRDWNERGHQAKGLGRQRRLDRVLSRQHFDPVGSDPFRRRPAKPNLSGHLADRGAGHDRGGRNGHLFLPHLQVQLGERRQLGHADRHSDRVLGRCYPHLRRPVLPGLHRGRERGRHLHEDEQRKLRGQRDDRHHQRRNIGSGLLGLARGETHTDLSATGETSRFLKQAATGSDITVVRLCGSLRFCWRLLEEHDSRRGFVGHPAEPDRREKRRDFLHGNQRQSGQDRHGRRPALVQRFLAPLSRRCRPDFLAVNLQIRSRLTVLASPKIAACY